MSVSVVIPFTSDEPWRARAADHVAASYQSKGFAVTVGSCAGPWRKAVAVADALRHTSADVLVVADADCLCVGVARAVAAVLGGAPWAMPHTAVHRLDQAATEAVYAGATAAATTGRTERPYRGFDGGGIVVLTRATWEQVPMDARFEGWGQEDEAWALALTSLVGPPARQPDDLYHLWHPAPARLTRHRGSEASKQLLVRYSRAARRGRGTMRALLAEARLAQAAA